MFTVTDMSDPRHTSAQFRAAAEAAVELFKSANPAAIDAANAQEFLALHGLTAVIAEQVEAVLLLIDAGKLTAAVSNVRSAFEYAITIQWLHQMPDQLEHFVNNSTRANKLVLTTGEQLGWDIPDQMLDILTEEIPDIDARIRHFEQLCHQFAEGKALYVHYRGLCSIVHPTLDAVARYATQTLDGSIALLNEPQGLEPDELLWACAQSMILALACREDLVHGKPNEQAVKDIAASIGMPSMLLLNPRKHSCPEGD